MLLHTLVIYADVKLQQTPEPDRQTRQSNQSVKPVPRKLASKIIFKKTFQGEAEHKCPGVNLLFFSAVSFDRVRPENDKKKKEKENSCL